VVQSDNATEPYEDRAAVGPGRALAARGLGVGFGRCRFRNRGTDSISESGIKWLHDREYKATMRPGPTWRRPAVRKCAAGAGPASSACSARRAAASTSAAASAAQPGGGQRGT
jgi:hypothetical protein